MLKCIEDLQGPWPRSPTKLAPEILLPWTCHACVSHFQCLNPPDAGSLNQWKEAKFIPVPKTYPIADINSDLCPISLNASPSKILESSIATWIMKTIHPELDPKQYGSQKGYSSANALIDIMLHTWHSNIDGNGKTLHIFLLDFSKAFDRINHKVLVTKMHQRGINKSIVNWVINFLNGRIQRVCGEAFDWSAVNGGVPQGTVYYRMNVLVETKFGNLHSTNRICFGLVGCQVAP